MTDFTRDLHLFSDGREIARGSGTSKKRAEQEAARAALLRVKRSGDWE